MTKTSLWWLLVPVVLVLGALGVLLVSLVRLPGAEPQCNIGPAALGPATSPQLLLQATLYLFEEGFISNAEDAFEAASKAGWVFDPQDEHRLEYWISFGEGRSLNTVGFEVICISPELTMVWTYDGVQLLPNE